MTLTLRWQRWILSLLIASVALWPAAAGAQSSNPVWLRSLDELMNVEVVTASRRARPLSDTAAAVFVLTAEDIRRSGLTTVPEVLRLVPGVQVAQIDGNNWAVTVRGFNSRWANKLLVMVDGRSVYSSVFSGVYWDAFEVPLDLIDRIEVVRGPGGSLWGANAVNGVINIITRTASVAGGAVAARGGSPGQVSGTARYAGRVSDRLKYQTFLAAGTQDASVRISNDYTDSIHLGGKIIATPSTRDTFELQATTLRSDTGGVTPIVISQAPLVRTQANAVTAVSAYHGTARWTRATNGGQLDVAASVTHSSRLDPVFAVESRVMEATMQHSIATQGAHEVTWGAAYRHSTELMDGTATFQMSPGTSREAQVGAFVQDNINLASDRVTLTVGAKFERFEHGGAHLQPTVRALWRPSARHTVWSAASRAVRTPSLSERGMTVNLFQVDGRVPMVAQLFGNPSLDRESLRSYEAGYRWHGAVVSIDAAAYYNEYDNAVNLEVGTPYFVRSPGVPHLILPVVFDNKMKATTAGGEAILTVAPSARWRVVGSYSLFTVSSRLAPGSRNFAAGAFDADAPRHQGSIRSLLSLPFDVEADATMFVVSGLEANGLPGYRRLDARLSWRASRTWDLAVVVRNALDSRHVEFTDSSSAVKHTPMRRQISVQTFWRF